MLANTYHFGFWYHLNMTLRLTKSLTLSLTLVKYLSAGQQDQIKLRFMVSRVTYLTQRDLDLVFACTFLSFSAQE